LLQGSGYYEAIATGIENVPIFIKADNAETEIEAFLQKAPLV